MMLLYSEMPILETRDLVKRFGDLVAVDHLHLSVREGICFGLLGPNGAGKTTTIEMMEGILAPTSGQILYRGAPVDRHFQEKIGIQFQSTSLPDRLLVGEVLSLFASFYREPMSLSEIIRWCDLGELVNRDASKLSGGQRQRLLLAVSLINDPDLVFLDEPTTGLDPHARRQFWALINAIKAKNKTIVLTTHYMEEAYELCDEIGIINRGKIIALGAPDQLLKEHFEGLSLRLPRSDVRGEIACIPGRAFETPEHVEIQTSDVNATIRHLIDAGTSLEGLQLRKKGLDDLFLALTGKGLGEEKDSGQKDAVS